MRSLALRWIALVVFAAVPIGVRAESLVSVRTGTFEPPVGLTSINGLVVVDGQLVTLTDPVAWKFDETQKKWASIEGEGTGIILGVVVDGSQSFAAVARTVDGPVDRIERLTFAAGKLARTALVPMPTPLTTAKIALLQGRLYVAGLDTGGKGELFSLDLKSAAAKWVSHGGWSDLTGSGAQVTSLVGQTSALFMTVRENGTSGKERLLRWTEKEGWRVRADVPGTVVPGAVRATGQAHLLFLLRAEASVPSRLMTFQTITGSWAELSGAGAMGAQVGVGWRNGMLWSRPAASGGGSEFGYAEIESRPVLLRWLDWIVIIAYLASMLGMGLYFYLREKRVSTSDFFVGGRSIPFWAAGVSLYAANTSSISYIAIPAKSFETNWQYLTNNLVAVAALVFVAIWIVPLLRRLNLMSVFHYLETRFHPLIRTLASALFIAVQIGSRMSVILFLPSLAIATITGIDVTWSILIMGVFTMIYTALGGMKAVIWTDFVQLIVKMGGIVFAIGFIVYSLRGGVGELFSIAAAESKMKLFDWSFDLTKATVWGFLFLVLFDVVLTFPKDQVLMQRVLSTKSDKDAGRSVWTFAAIMIPGGFMFYMVGTALFAFYKTHPERMNPMLTIDATFPLFIAAELPMGLRGLIIAGILAAAMATLSSIMNSVATLASVDFYEKLVKRTNAKTSVRFAEAMTVLTGIIGMGVALLLSRYDIHSLFDISIELAGLLGGGFAGAYTLGMFTRRANAQGVAIGVAVSISVTTVAWFMKLVHPYFYLAISILVCIVVGYLASLFFPPPKQSLRGLTIYAEKPTDL
ncbi:MAG: sodium:solute symporter [Opitutus sp.]